MHIAQGIVRQWNLVSGGESPIPFSGKIKFSISLDQYSKVLCLFLSQTEGYWNILKLSCRPLAALNSY